MKKIYKAPIQKVVEIATEELIAESFQVFSAGDDPEIESSEEILTKELSSKNLWDNQW